MNRCTWSFAVPQDECRAVEAEWSPSCSYREGHGLILIFVIQRSIVVRVSTDQVTHWVRLTGSSWPIQEL